MKKRITRLTTMIMAVFIMAIIAALPVTAFAASSDTAVAISEEANVYDSDMTVIQPMVNNYEEPVIQQLGNNTPKTDLASHFPCESLKVLKC